MADLPYFSQFPQNASARVNLGIALASPNGHLEEGIAELTQGIDLAPQSANVHNGLGVALARAGRVEDAAIHVEKAVRLMPQSADCCYNLGREGLNCGSIGAVLAGGEADRAPGASDSGDARRHVLQHQAANRRPSKTHG